MEIRNRKPIKKLNALNLEQELFLDYINYRYKFAKYNKKITFIIRQLVGNDKFEDMVYCYDKFDNLSNKEKRVISKDICVLRYGKKLGIVEYNKFLNIMSKSTQSQYDSGCRVVHNVRSFQYWVDRGYSISDAKNKVSLISKGSGAKAWKTRVKNPNWKLDMNTNLDFYLNKGYDLKTAENMLKERQSTFTLNKNIERYGLVRGSIKFKARQHKWRRSMILKSEHELLEINKKRISLSSVSIESINFFNRLIKYINIPKNSRVYYGESGEYWLKKTPTNVLFYDFTLKTDQYIIIVEYHGIAWHPKEGQLDWKSPVGVLYEEAIVKDRLKAKIAAENKINYFHIYSDYSNDDFDKLIEDINDCIKSKN